MLRRPASLVKQRGAALMAALFLIIVVAALGVFAVRLNSDTQQIANLELLQLRALAAANSGIEYGSYQASNGTCAPLANFVFDSTAPGLEGFDVTVRCIPIAMGANFVYELHANASRGNFGNPDFVQREATRRVTDIPPGVW